MMSNINSLSKVQIASAIFLVTFGQDIAVAQSDSAGVIDEITVTATKRASNLQDTPISIAAFSMSQLDDAGVQNVTDLRSIVPGLHIGTSTSSGVNLIALRGISSTNIRLIGDPTVAYHVDGIYRGRQTAGNMAFYDLERIEVVKGPQGTLYGRNATAGSINVISAKPKDFFEANTELTLGNYSEVQVRAMINLPVSDSFALRLSAARLVRDGYQENGPLVSDNLGDADETMGRLRALYTPNENLSILFGFDISNNGGVGGADGA
jgi:iron complex outermembrane receptor protein